VGQVFAAFAGERKNVLLQASVGALTVSECPQTLVGKRYVAWARVGAERIGDSGMRAGASVVCKFAHFVESSYFDSPQRGSLAYYTLGEKGSWLVPEHWQDKAGV
jgi:hypothetical protein